MTVAKAELRDRLEHAVQLDAGETKLAELQSVIAHAEAAGLIDLLFEARLWLVETLTDLKNVYLNAPDLIAAYVRWLTLWRTHPAQFDEEDGDTVWRGFAILCRVLTEAADRPYGQILALCDEMEQHCRPRSGDAHLVCWTRLKVAERRGDFATADAEFRRSRTLEVSPLVSPGRLVLEQVGYLAHRGRDDEAIAALQPALDGRVQLDATDEGIGTADPQDLLENLLMPYLRTGRLAEARAAHLRTRDRELDGHRLAQHLEFCARSGNEEAGRELLLRHLDWVGGPVMTCYQLRIWGAASLLCRRLGELGRGAETWIWAADPADPEDYDEEWTYDRLLGELLEEAREFAAKLDECNGTGYQSARTEALIHAEPIVARLPL